MLNEFLKSLKLREEIGYKIKEEIKEYTKLITEKYNYNHLIDNYDNDKLLLIKSIEEYVKNNECDKFINSVDAYDYYRELDPIFELWGSNTAGDVDTYITIKSNRIVVEKVKTIHVQCSEDDDEEISIYNIPLEYFEKGK